MVLAVFGACAVREPCKPLRKRGWPTSARTIGTAVANVAVAGIVWLFVGRRFGACPSSQRNGCSEAIAPGFRDTPRRLNAHGVSPKKRIVPCMPSLDPAPVTYWFAPGLWFSRKETEPPSICCTAQQSKINAEERSRVSAFGVLWVPYPTASNVVCCVVIIVLETERNGTRLRRSDRQNSASCVSRGPKKPTNLSRQ